MTVLELMHSLSKFDPGDEVKVNITNLAARLNTYTEQEVEAVEPIFNIEGWDGGVLVVVDL